MKEYPAVSASLLEKHGREDVVCLLDVCQGDEAVASYRDTSHQNPARETFSARWVMIEMLSGEDLAREAIHQALK